MILQIGAYARPVEHDGNATLAQMVRRTDAGQQHDLRRTDRAGGENHFAATAREARFAILAPAHADGAFLLEHDAFDQAAGLETQVAAIECRLEKCARRRPAPPAFLVHMKGAAALVVAGIEIGDGFDAGLFGRLAERVEQRPLHARRLDAQFAARSVLVAFTEEMIFVSLEIGQHVVPAPAR